MPDWIVSDILPLCCMAVFASQLRIPKVFLPNRVGTPSRGLGNPALPEPYPIQNWLRRTYGRSAEQMDMIGQNYIATDHPMISLLPSIKNRLMHGRRGEQRCALLGANRQEDQHGPVAGGKNRLMNRTVTGREGLGGFRVWCHSRPSWSWALHGKTGKAKIPLTTDPSARRPPGRR
jgi:hypothetical protein